MEFVHGFLIGLALVAPIGPVALTLMGVSVERGRRAGLAGALGVTLADAVLVLMTVAAADRIGGLGTGWVRPTELIFGAAVGLLGFGALFRAGKTRALLARVERPTPALLAMTLSNPLSLALWMGVVLALPPAMLHPAALLRFGAGIVLASALWHTGLGLTGAWLGSRLSERAKAWSPRLAGVVMLGVAGMLVA